MAVDTRVKHRYSPGHMAVEHDQVQSMQRVKVGLVGLAVVVLLIGVASAIMRTVTRETPVTTIGAPKAEVVANMVLANTQAGVGAPLVEVGVAPAAGNAQAATPRR